MDIPAVAKFCESASLRLDGDTEGVVDYLAEAPRKPAQQVLLFISSEAEPTAYLTTVPGCALCSQGRAADDRSMADGNDCSSQRMDFNSGVRLLDSMWQENNMIWEAWS